MLKPRIIPCLLVQDGGLVKTIKFKNAKYVGDPINAVRIFNEKEADELIVLDIDATVNDTEPNYKMIANLAKECRMPLCYGGGIKTLAQAEKIISLGVEKVSLSSIVVDNPNLIFEISEKLGRQSVVVVLDIKKNILSNNYTIWTHNATQNSKRNVSEMISIIQKIGVGEIVLNFIDYDGTGKGYPIEVIQKFKRQINVPLTIMGGANALEDMSNAVKKCGLLGVAAGSLFVFKGNYRAVLINYPEPKHKERLIYEK